ncbi:MAG: transposase [Clostridium sp.]|uniref:transposase n=1 Tax=Clostridium TaxID=1485 RepID=UPI0013D2289A|nr:MULTISPECIES: transposase [Clostridium]EJE7234237.1 transposase [Clostridium botulinum]MDU7252729.1 transposase [Clostridium sp.]NFE82337.1 transposase [Clostridium sporogenes]NFG70054.1 transposase [Clostridium sporogenes]
MKKSIKRNYIKDISKIIINKVRINIRGYISSIIISLINTWVNKLVSSRNSILGKPSNNIAKSTDIYFLILSAMILFTYYYLHKH